MKFTDAEQRILDYLKDRIDFVSPTEIGTEVGGRDKYGFRRHSSWASPKCRRLVEKLVLERNEKGWYRRF